MPQSRGRRQGRHRPHLDPLGGTPRLLSVDDTPPVRGRVRERFEAAIAAGPAAGAHPDDLSVVDSLTQAPLAGIGEVPYGSNAVFLVQLDAADPASPDEPMRAVYKPARGERPLWDFPRQTLYLREVAAYAVDAALGLRHVPPTVLRDGPAGPGSMQLFVHAARRRPSAEAAEEIEAQLHDVAMLDVLINNADRKRSHLMVKQDMRVAAIDNALSFLPYPRQRTALITLGGSRLPARARAPLRALADDGERLDALLTRLRQLLSEHEADAFRGRVTELAADPVYPVLDDWDGRPFEWW